MICLTWCITHNLNIWNILRQACSRFCSVFLNLNYFVLFCGSFRDNDEKKPRFGSLPVLNMPKRSHDTKPKRRTPRSVHVVKDHLPLPRQAVYKNSKELCQWTSGLRSLNDWNMKLITTDLLQKWSWTLSSFHNLKLLSMTSLALQYY